MNISAISTNRQYSYKKNQPSFEKLIMDQRNFHKLPNHVKRVMEDLFEKLPNALKEAGVDIDNPNKAVLVTTYHNHSGAAIEVTSPSRYGLTKTNYSGPFNLESIVKIVKEQLEAPNTISFETMLNSCKAVDIVPPIPTNAWSF